MTGLGIALSVKKSAAEIREVLERWFLALAIENWDMNLMVRAILWMRATPPADGCSALDW